MKSKVLRALAGLLSVLGALLPGRALAQGSIPFTINNTSPFADGDLYVAIVGLDTNNNHVWINAANSQVLPMSPGYNTVTGPTVNGNTGPGQNSKYAACFTKLSNIPNRTFTLPLMPAAGCTSRAGSSCTSTFLGPTARPRATPRPTRRTPPTPIRVFSTKPLS